MLKHLFDFANLYIIGCAVIGVVYADTGIRLDPGCPSFECDLLAITILQCHLLSGGGALHCAATLLRFL